MIGKTRSRRIKVLFLCGAAGSTFVVILWAAYIFAAIWLRVRCARELAADATALPDVHPDKLPAEIATLLFASIGQHVNQPPLDRLEALQHPTLGTVLRHLLGRADGNESVQTEQFRSVAFSPQGRLIVNGGAAMGDLDNDAHLDFVVSDSSPPVLSNQFISKIVTLFEPRKRCYTVTDSRGEKLIIAFRSTARDPNEAPDPAKPVVEELLCIDSAGRIIGRSLIRSGSLLGKLPELSGKADQIVFGETEYTNNQNGVFTKMGPASICIIEDGRLKTIQAIGTEPVEIERLDGQ